MKMKLELVCDEVLFDCFDYLSLIEIFRSFTYLSKQFNKLLIDYLKRNLQFNLQSANIYDILAVCRLYLPESVDEIISLCFSHGEKIPLAIELSSLTFQSVLSRREMTSIINQLNSYSNLISLNLIDCSFDFVDSSINQIWSLSTLKQFHFSSLKCCRNISLNLSVCSSSIQSIRIQNIFLNRKSLNDLLYFTPCLQRLRISTEKNDKYFDVDHLFDLTKFELIEIDDPCTNLLFKEDRLINLLQTMPNLLDLSVTMSNMLLDGYQWQYLIINYLPQLKVFQCRMEKSFARGQKISTIIDHLLQSFQTKFWIITHKWFIRCHCNATDSYHHRVLYYTIPSVFRKLTVRSRSISQDISSINDQFIITQRPISWFKKINKLLGSASCLADTSSISSLTTVYELTIDRAFNIYLSRFIGKLDQLNSLHILFYNKNSKINEFQLQVLLDHAPNLSTLSIIHYINMSKRFILNNLTSQSIYQLNLRKMNHSYASIAYDMNKCIDLTRSFLGQQCEILTVRVTNKYCIAYLVKNMTHLRLLKVYCQDYQYHRFLKANETERTLLSIEYDRLTQWLHTHLPPSVKIERYRDPIDTVHIWIPH